MTLQSVQFEVIQPVDEDGREANIRASLKRGLRNFDARDLAHINVIANGPSARDVDLAKLEGPTVAVNGAIKLFTAQGLAPTYWAGCDPQALLASFLPDDPPKATTYLVASKCDPAVFDKLKDRDVKLWHIGDSDLVKGHRPVKVASSVTLCILSQMRRVGFRSFDVYGWDACYSADGFHHATEPKEDFRLHSQIELRVGATMAQKPYVLGEGEDFAWTYLGADPPEFIEEPEGGRPIHTNHTWALESQDAVTQLHHADYEVRIHGDGLIKAMTKR